MGPLFSDYVRAPKEQPRVWRLSGVRIRLYSRPRFVAVHAGRAEPAGWGGPEEGRSKVPRVPSRWRHVGRVTSPAASRGSRPERPTCEGARSGFCGDLSPRRPLPGTFQSSRLPAGKQFSISYTVGRGPVKLLICSGMTAMLPSPRVSGTGRGRAVPPEDGCPSLLFCVPALPGRSMSCGPRRVQKWFLGR